MSTIMSTVEPNDTPRSSQRSSVSAALSPTWRPPKAPLPPHRLAKLANALGVSTPMPAGLNYPGPGTPSFLSRSVSESAGPPDYLRRSPTPSATSSRSFAPPNPQTSKFLLHVVPPMHLPHDSDASNDSDMTPPPPSASGYHSQFRRGTLVPVHPTLQAQLGAIAKEYALPSTAGMVLYLVSSGTNPVQSPLSPDDLHEPGPRLSEDIWRHLWTRVVQAEQRDGNMLLPPRSPTPLTLGSPSTPFLPQEFNRNHLLSPSPSPISPRPSYPPSPSPASSFSDLRSNTKSAPPSSASATQSEPDTPNTSVSELRADSFDLPGLNSPSLIPILAKVEFDIDRKKAAGWYDRWLKSRRDNHAKRVGGRKNSMPAEQTNEESSSSSDSKAKDKAPVIPLMIGRKETASPLGILPSDPSTEVEVEVEVEESAVGAGYEQLSDTQEGYDESDSDDDMDDFAEDSTARVSSIVEKKDPLEDVFGSDADTWQDMKAERRNTHEIDPDDIDLSLTAGDLSEEPSFGGDMDESRFTTREEEEVRELLDRMSQSGKTTPDPFGASSPQSITKKIPPPLVLVPNDSSSPIIAAEASPLPSATATGAKLAYLDSPDNGSDLEGNEYRSRSPAESEKRSGALFEDLDLGLDPSEDYDTDDPNDRRKSQIVMRQQLDEIERTLAQLSPRFANAHLEEEMDKSYHSMSTLSPGSPMKLTLSPLRNSENATTSRLPQHPDSPEGAPAGGASWPAVPFSQIKDTSSSSTDGANRPPSPPKLALNGVTTSAPPSFKPNGGDEVSPETILRMKKLEEEQALFRKPSSSTDSPVIPLSPDPFGRYSSSTLDPPIISAPEGWDTATVGRTSIQLGDGENQATPKRARSGTTSRFSTDSLVESAPVAAPAKSNRGTLISVKSIKNLWRKSNKGDREKEKAEKAQAASASGRVSPGVPQRPERPSQETLDLPDVPPLPPNASFGRISPQPIPGSSDMNRRPSQDSGMQGRASLEQSRRPSGEMPRPPQGVPAQVMYPGLSVPPYANATRTNTQPIVPQMLSSRPGSNLVNLRFDQESPYPNPVRNPPPPQRYGGGQRPPSPPQTSPPPHMQAHAASQLPSIPEQEALARRSLSQKWNSTSSNGHNHYPQDPPGQHQQYQPQHQHQQRVSFDRQSNASVRTNGSYAPSLNNGRKASVSSDLAPQLSPRMPDHFGNGRPSFTGSEHSLRSPTSPMPMDSGSSLAGSPPMQYHRPLGARSVSPAASFASSHASIDESQFEIVSPKMQGGMGYPTVHYNGNVSMSSSGS